MGSMIDFKRPDGTTCRGYFAEAGAGKPGIVVLQEWWGLNDQIKGVAECSVIGRPHPEWGEEVVAFVVARDGAVPTPADLDRLCLDNIARFKRPKDYRFVAALPKNNYGKILKTELRQQLGQSENRGD